MRKLFVLFSLLLLVGCATTKPTVLIDTESYYKIPANTTFKAVVSDDGKVEDVQRPFDSYSVSAGYLIKLQEQANACTLNN